MELGRLWYDLPLIECVTLIVARLFAVAYDKKKADEDSNPAYDDLIQWLSETPYELLSPEEREMRDDDALLSAFGLTRDMANG